MNAVEAMKARRLVRYAYEIYELQPWNRSDQVGIVSIQLNNRKTPYYVVFVEESIVVLPNVAALVGLFMNAQSELMPSIQRLRYQQHLLCTFVDPNDVDEAMMTLFTESEAQVKDELLPIFESTMPSLLPDVLVKKEIDVLVDVYAQVISALKEIISTTHVIDFETQMHGWYFDYEQKSWVLTTLNLPSSHIDVEAIKLSEESLNIINQAQALEDVWECDIAYTSVMLEAQENHRQHAIRLCMITHHEAPLIYAQALINPDGNPYQQLSETLVNVIQERGRPVKLVVRDQIMKDVFQLICDSSNMMIEVSEVLETIDLFVEELSQSMM